MDTFVETVEIEGHEEYRVEVHHDDWPLNPRTDYDNLGVMVCGHRRYNLGDEHDINFDHYSGWDEVEEHICKTEDVAIILPLYLYDHSGISISTNSFYGRAPHAAWDSGRVGFIYVTKPAARKWFGWKLITQKRMERLEKALVSEVELYDYYIQGAVYTMYIYDKDGGLIDGPYGGFFGWNHKESGLLFEARCIIEGWKKGWERQLQKEAEEEAEREWNRKLQLPLLATYAGGAA